MPRISFLYRTDVHWSERNPISWKANYLSELVSSLTQVGTLAKQLDVNSVLDGGDFFNTKAANRNSHASVEQAATLHKKSYHCPVITIPGNHDIAYNNMHTLPKQPLGVLYATHVFQQLSETVYQDGPLRVRVVGVPYCTKRTLEDLLKIQKQPGDTFLVAVVHALASPDPPPMVEEFFGEPVFRYSDLVTPDGPDCWAFGHWHKDQGIVNIEGKTFVNQGALSRGALVKENTFRIPKVAHLVFEQSHFEVSGIPLEVAPAEDVFDMEKKERQEKEGVEIDTFISKLQSEMVFDSSTSIEDNLASLCFSQDIRELAHAYLEQARSEVG